MYLFNWFDMQVFVLWKVDDLTLGKVLFPNKHKMETILVNIEFCIKVLWTLFKHILVRHVFFCNKIKRTQDLFQTEQHYCPLYRSSLNWFHLVISFLDLRLVLSFTVCKELNGYLSSWTPSFKCGITLAGSEGHR